MTAAATGGMPSGRIEAPHIGRTAVVTIATVTVASFVLSVVAVFDWGPLPGPYLQYLVAGLLVSLANGAVGALVALVEIAVRDRGRDDPWLPLERWHRVLLTVAGVLIVPTTILLDVWIRNDGPGDIRGVPFAIVLVAVAAVLVLAGRAVMLAAADPARLTGGGTPRALRLVEVALGIGLGLVLAFGPVIVNSVLRYGRDVAVPDAPQVDMEVRTYVALGDSYSAGEGISPYDEGTEAVDDGGNGCHRSRTEAYSELIPFEPDVDPVFVACSGAVTRDVEQAYTEPFDDPEGVAVPAQVPAEPAADPTVDLVTITMGGNDLLFSKVVRHCLTHADCTNDTFDPDLPDRHTEGIYPHTGAALELDDWAHGVERKLATTLGATYSTLRSHYPDARIVVLGYPYLFPEGDAGYTLTDCDTVLRMASEKERGRLHDLQEGFNRTLYDAAVAADVEFVSPEAIWAGHEPCGERGQYTNAVKPIFGSSGSFHPNRDGQHAYAALLACYLSSTTRPPTNEPVVLRGEASVPADAPPPGSTAREVTCDG